MLHSIRWRLMAGLAGTALLATVALGAVLILTLRSYYGGQETKYLTGNARAISKSLGAMQAGSSALAGPERKQIESFAFMTQARVRLLDPQGRTYYDSGSPSSNVDVAFGVLQYKTWITATLPGQTIRNVEMPDYLQVISVGHGLTQTARLQLPAPADGVDRRMIIAFRSMPVAGTLYGFGLDAAPGTNGERSSRKVRVPFDDAQGQPAGFVELSEGPAYGGDIVGSVARSWALAGCVAVLLACAAGWLISGRITAPLHALAGVTQRMAAGDLGARATVRGRDEMGRLAESFNRMATRVESTIVTLRQFVADATHQIHTPLTALRMNLELAAAAGPGGKQLAYLERAQGQVARLERLVDELLQLARVEAGTGTPGAQPVDLAALVRDLCEAQAARAEQAGIEFSLETSESVMVMGDACQLRGLVENLADNALKFTPPGGTVAVTLAKCDGWACLTVEDSGIGIPAEDMSQLFGRFHRGRNVAAFPGSGLGLAIVKAVAEQHGGSVAAQQTGHGSLFTVRLPAAG